MAKDNILLQRNVSLNETGLYNGNKVLMFVLYDFYKGQNFEDNGLMLPCSSIIPLQVLFFIVVMKHSPLDCISRASTEQMYKLIGKDSAMKTIEQCQATTTFPTLTFYGN